MDWVSGVGKWSGYVCRYMVLPCSLYIGQNRLSDQPVLHRFPYSNSLAEPDPLRDKP